MYNVIIYDYIWAEIKIVSETGVCSHWLQKYKVCNQLLWPVLALNYVYSVRGKTTAQYAIFSAPWHSYNTSKFYIQTLITYF